MRTTTLALAAGAAALAAVPAAATCGTHLRKSAAALAAPAGGAASSCAPYNVWVNFGATPDAAAVTWSTNCSDASGAVAYGGAPAAMNGTATGVQTQYTFSYQGSYTSPYIHHAALSGLGAGATVYYRVGSAASGWSATFNFSANPGAGLIPGRVAKFAIVGDLGQTDNTVDTLAHIVDAPLRSFTAMIIPGDLSYANSVEPKWDMWQTMMAPVASTLPVMTIVGNHEQEYTTTGSSFIAYETRFPMPGLPSALWYSWESGGVHFVMLSSYSTFTAGSPQYAWLQADLAAIDRSRTPWVAVHMHAPWYNSNYAHQGEGEAMRVAMEELLYNAKVDVVFAGHVHAYERCTRSYNMAPNSAGPYYITIGDGGNAEGLAASWMSPQPAWSAFRQASYGHGELQVFNATHALWTWHQNPDLQPTVADSLWIVKGSETLAAPITAQPVAAPGVTLRFAPPHNRVPGHLLRPRDVPV